MKMDDRHEEPFVLDETCDFAVVYKPAKMHCAPRDYNIFHKSKEGGEGTLLDWYCNKKKSAGEDKLMHRLDFETHGLVLFARNEKSFQFFADLQNRGEFIKEYSAVCTKADCFTEFDGFPNFSCNITHEVHETACQNENKSNQNICVTQWFNNLPFAVESYFRPYGPGRKLVRPVIGNSKKLKEIAKDQGGYYKTEIINISGVGGEASGGIFSARIKRGFRHQIRCHLCWIGFPINNDPLYSAMLKAKGSPDEKLALRAHSLFFADPANGKPKEYNISPLN